MKVFLKWVLIILITALLVFAALIITLNILYDRAENSVPDDMTFTLRTNDDGSLLLNWTSADNAERYIVDVHINSVSKRNTFTTTYNVKSRASSLVFSTIVEECSCILPANLPNDRQLIVTISTENDYLNLFSNTYTRKGENTANLIFQSVFPNVTLTASTDDQEAYIEWNAHDGDDYRLFVYSGDEKPRDITDSVTQSELGRITVSFGKDGALPLPENDSSYSFILVVYRNEEKIILDGLSALPVSVERKQLLGPVPVVEYSADGNNVYTLSWTETNGNGYEVQQLEADGTWSTLAVIDRPDMLSYTTNHLKPFTNYTMRVVTLGAQTEDETESTVPSEPIQLCTEQSPVYATVWPLKDLNIYSDTDMTQTIGTAKAASAFCVLDEVNGMFLVAFPEGQGYIDSNYCLINLPEYFGSLCSYNITNSYSSIYMVHEYEIPEVTDTIVKGYERVQLYDDSYLVPLVYPTARKLVAAALTAKEYGYRLKIYDSYRPYIATRSIYDLTQSIIDEPLPEKTFTGKAVNNLPKPKEDEELTYKLVMTNNVWGLSSFLADTSSTHNLGIALDLTLESAETGEEILMQTSMHDLSWYSAKGMNTILSNVLATMMLDAGFTELSSEWWHFHDSETSRTYGLAPLYGGVSPACWMKDDFGWRYRMGDGRYCVDQTCVIGGAEYTFDENGYLVEH